MNRLAARTLLAVFVVVATLPSLLAQQTVAPAFPSADPASLGFDATKLDRVSTALQQFVDDDKIAGAVVGVARRGRLVMLEAVGMKDIDRRAPMTTDSIFPDLFDDQTDHVGGGDDLGR